MREVPRPVPSTDELLVRVHASGVNRADVLQRRGRYAAPPGAPRDIPGLEFAGVVEALGRADLPWGVGDRIMGIVAGGGYAEYLTLPAEHAIPIPAGWAFAEAAAVPEAFVTAHDALIRCADLRDDEHVLIHAVGSGVGTAMVQLARAAGATVAGTSRTPDKLERARTLGLQHPVLVKQRFQPPRDLCDWAHVIGDLVGGHYLPGSLAAAAPRGRIVVVGLTAGRVAEVDLGMLLTKRLSLIGTVLRSRSRQEKTEVIDSFSRAVLPLFAAGQLVPVLDRVFPATAAAAAHAYMEQNRTFGSIVLSWEGDDAPAST